MSQRSFVVLGVIIVTGFLAFGVVKSRPPWNFKPIDNRLPQPAPQKERPVPRPVFPKGWTAPQPLSMAALKQWSTEVPANAPMRAATTYASSYSEILNYVVAPDAVYASVCTGYKNSLLAWKKNGRPLWDRTLSNTTSKTRFSRFVYGLPMAVAGQQLLVPCSDVGPNRTSELWWIDRQSGETVNKMPLEGPLFALAYYPKEQLILAIVSVVESVTAGGEMRVRTDVVAYSPARREVWRRKFSPHDVQPLTRPLRFDGEVVVLTNRPPGYPHEQVQGQRPVYVKRLDPATGHDMWSVSPAIAPSVPQLTSTSGTLEEGVSIYFQGHVLAYSMATGQNIWQWKIPSTFLGLPIMLKGDTKRLYVARDAPQAGPPPGAIEYPSGKIAWSDSTVEAYYEPPVVWGDKVVYLAWPPSTPTTGVLPFTRLYIRSGKSAYLLTRKEVDLRSRISPQVHDDLLYTTNDRNIVAYRWLGK